MTEIVFGFGVSHGPLLDQPVERMRAAAGPLFETGLDMRLRDYVPCYRSEASTGCAMGFAVWQ